MTPVAQQSTGLPYRCLPTTSGAAQERNNLVIPAAAGCSASGNVRHTLTQVLGRPTGVFD